MDLNRVPNDQKLFLCRFYFKVGFLFLPFVWAVNTCWFFSEAFKKPPYDEQKQIKNYVIWSGIGTLLWAIIIVTWIVTFQLNRALWGEVGDDLSFIIPLGRA
ncbi:presenilin enhancer, gamma-secretase subunit [Arctopsyche grandis]|uniref:presenilin enhancer, gamma-secretase subunit n=1 Tax=Arctopsyche grandis TaxID=121162 RepID=UPI00406D6739